jgi:hypothetical protein
MFASSSTYAHDRSRHRHNHTVSREPRKVYTGPTAMYQTCNTSFVLSCKNARVVARKLGSKWKGDKTCIWVPKVIVTNLVGPNKSWVPKTQALLLCRFMHPGAQAGLSTADAEST